MHSISLPRQIPNEVRPFDWLSHHHFLFDVPIYILILLTQVDEPPTSTPSPTLHEQRLPPLTNTHYKSQRVTWSGSPELHAVSKGILLIRIHTFNHALPTCTSHNIFVFFLVVFHKRLTPLTTFNRKYVQRGSS